MSTLKVSNISDGAITVPVDRIMRGTPKAWVLFDGYTSPIEIKAHLNVTSITDLGVGNYVLNFNKPMANLNYGIIGSTLADSNTVSATLGVAMAGNYTTGPANKTLSSCNVRHASSSAYDTKELFVAVIGD